MTTLRTPFPDPELEFLFAVAARASDNESGIDVVDVKRLNEMRLLELAGRHGMRALVGRYGGLKDSSLNEYPKLNAHWNLRKTGEMVSIIRLFEEASIEVITYKGPTLADLAYGDLGLREFGDLDLLINSSGFTKAHGIMCDLGYEPEIDLDWSRWSSFIATTNVLAYWHAEKESSVELHWELSPRYLPFPIDFRTLYGRREPSYPGGREVMTMSGGDLLLYLCLHGAKHAWERMSWIVDVGGLISRHRGIDWDRLQSDAVGCERALCLGLALAQAVTNVELPAQAEKMIAGDTDIAGLFDQVMGWIGGNETQSLVSQTRFLLRLQKSRAARARMLYRIVTTPSVADWRAVRLPGPLIWMYWPIRLVRLIGAAIRA